MTTNRIRGLDSIRFLAALFVVFWHHCYFPVAELISDTHWLGWLINGIHNNLFSGPAAVIIFFVLSGFVIHYPYFNGKEFKPLDFFLRRYIRIIGPLAVAIVVSHLIGYKLDLFGKAILWTLAAELIYYTIYPVLRSLRKRVSWRWIVGTSFALSLLVILTNPSAGDYPSYGIALNWLLGLPCWLLGCWLAESNWGGGRADKGEKAPSIAPVVAWRLRIYALMIVLSVLRYHTPIGYPWTLNLFAIAVFFWLRAEIIHFNFAPNAPPSKKLEWLGIWSYSLYLSHQLARGILTSHIKLPDLGHIPNWTIKITFILVFAYLFYLLIEKPFHHLARWTAKKTSKSPAQL